MLGVIGYKPAVLARLDPRTLRPLPGPRVRLRYGVSSYGWSPDRSLLVLGDVDDDALHLVDPVRHLRQPASLLRRLAHWLVPPAGAKQAAGTWRGACWLGDGLLALSGFDPGAASVSWRAGRLVSTGGTWNSEAQVERGTGVTLFGPGDRPPRHLLGTRMVWDAYRNGDLVYADLDIGTERSLHVAVSLRTGRVLASSDAPLPLLLLDERDRPC